MEIKIEIAEATISRFSTVTLSYTDDQGNERNADLQIDFLPLFDYAKDTSSTRFDFFLISALVYGIDNLINRENFSVDGWARELEVTFPVKNINRWSGNEQLLSDLLKFLTGDYWTISFENLTVTDLFVEKNGRWSKNIPSYVYQEIVKVSLFSGGLDSLIGVIDILHTLTANEKILLISHFDSNSVGPNSDQIALHEILSKNFVDKIYWIQSTVTLDRKDSNGAYLQLEDSYRSRSLLFMGIAIYMFNDLIQSNELVIPENGTISLNYPLTPSRVSSLSTRTTHPYVLTLIQNLVTNVIKNISVTNPYSLKTKGEMVSGCLDHTVLNLTYPRSVSCGKRGRKSHWAIKTGTSHCGVCMPCIYRRAGLHKNGLDKQVYGNDILNASSVNDFMDMPALFDYLKTTLPKEKIKRDLLVNGSLPLGGLDNFAEVVLRSRTELYKWFSDKGNEFVKRQLGII